MVNYWVLIIFGAAIIATFLWRRFARHGKGEKRHITFEEMREWSDDKILTHTDAEELADDKRKLALFNVVSEHVNDKHRLKGHLTPSEYKAYEKEYEKLKRHAPSNVSELYEHLARLYKDEHNRKLASQKMAA